MVSLMTSMSSRLSDVSFGWEEVSLSEWDDGSTTSVSSYDSAYNIKAKAVGFRSRAGNVKKQYEEMKEKTIKTESFSQSNTSKAHELSESEDSSIELHAASAFSSKQLNSSLNLTETANSSIISSSSKNVEDDRFSSSESDESDCNLEETNRNISEISVGTNEKIDLRQSNEVAGSKDCSPVKLEGQLSVENIGDEEIWMVQCPFDLDPKKLVNKELDFSGISEFAIETENTKKFYTATACAGRWKSLSCLLPSVERKQLEAVVVNAAGQIIITEKVMNSQLISTIPARSNKMEFPESLKMRHPLFGADYEKELDIRRQRLLVSPKKKKKKKKKERKEVPKDISYETIIEDKADNCIPSLSDDMELQMNSSVMSKKTKKRQRSESFNMKSDHSDGDDTGKLEGKHLKKKLRKSLSSNSVDESMEIEPPVYQEFTIKKKKKKKKHAVE